MNKLDETLIFSVEFLEDMQYISVAFIVLLRVALSLEDISVMYSWVPRYVHA